MWPNTGRPTAVGRDVNEPITYDNHMKRLSNMFRCLSGSAGHLAGTVSIWPKKTSWYASRPAIAHYATHSRLLIHHFQSYKYPFSSLSLSPLLSFPSPTLVANLPKVVSFSFPVSSFSAYLPGLPLSLGLYRPLSSLRNGGFQE